MLRRICKAGAPLGNPVRFQRANLKQRCHPDRAAHTSTLTYVILSGGSRQVPHAYLTMQYAKTNATMSSGIAMKMSFTFKPFTNARRM